MSSITDICNRALTKVGHKRVIKIEDQSACEHAYPFVRDAVLREHPWNCTMTRVTLASLSVAPDWDYDYAYPIPADCIKVVEVNTEYPWVIERHEGQQCILTDAGTALEIRYQMKLEDSAQYDALLFEVVAAALAVEICEELTQSNTKKAALERSYNSLLKQAKRNDAQEGSYSRFREDSWVTVRL